MSERLKKIIEKAQSGDFVGAQEELFEELDDRKERVKTEINEAVIGNALHENAKASRKVSGIGFITVYRDKATVKVGGMRDAIKVAPAFAALMDGEDSSKYEAEEGAQANVITVTDSNGDSYDLFLENGELKYVGDFSPKEISSFNKSGKI